MSVRLGPRGSHNSPVAQRKSGALSPPKTSPLAQRQSSAPTKRRPTFRNRQGLPMPCSSGGIEKDSVVEVQGAHVERVLRPDGQHGQARQHSVASTCPRAPIRCTYERITERKGSAATSRVAPS